MPLLYQTATCRLVVRSPSFWNVPNSTWASKLGQYLHRKFRTFGGVCSNHNFFQRLLSWWARECSPKDGLCRRRASWYAIFTKKSFLLIFLPIEFIPGGSVSEFNTQNVISGEVIEQGFERSFIPLASCCIEQAIDVEGLICTRSKTLRSW